MWIRAGPSKPITLLNLIWKFHDSRFENSTLFVINRPKIHQPKQTSADIAISERRCQHDTNDQIPRTPSYIYIYIYIIVSVKKNTEGSQQRHTGYSHPFSDPFSSFTIVQLSRIRVNLLIHVFQKFTYLVPWFYSIIKMSGLFKFWQFLNQLLI